MINIAQRQEIHELILLDLAIRSLQADYVKLTKLKLHRLYSEWLETILQQLQSQFHEKKLRLAQQHIRLVGYKRLDTYFSEITVATAGSDSQLLYANEVLKQDVEQLLMRCVRLHITSFHEE
ncbi:MAG: aconitate hydratase [Lysinibacillus sp.]